MEEVYAILEDKLQDATIVAVDNGVLYLRLENGKEVEIYLDDAQVGEIVDQISEGEIEED